MESEESKEEEREINDKGNKLYGIILTRMVGVL